MQLTMTATYATSPEQVLAMFSDPDFHALVREATHSTSGDVAISERDGGTHIVATRTMRTTSFPDFMKSIVGSSIRVIQTSWWGPAEPDGRRTGRVTVEVEGTPVRLDSQAALVPTPEGSEARYDGALVAKVPFVGGRIEKAAAPFVEQGLQAEEKAGARWLADHG